MLFRLRSFFGKAIVNPMVRKKMTVEMLRLGKGKKISALTAYDYPTAKLLDEAGVDLILVGDSLGMVALGYPDTTCVTMEEMEHHLRAVARARPLSLLGADLPFESYENPESAVDNARRLVAAGAEIVKAEGGFAILDQVKAIIENGIPFMGHLGMLPQHVRAEGGYKIKGKTAEERDSLMAEALALVKSGASAIVLELVVPEVAREITRRTSVPTIGIGSGPDCDGQILVTNDLVGTFPWFTPRFVKPLMNGAEQMKAAVQKWKKSF